MVATRSPSIPVVGPLHDLSSISWPGVAGKFLPMPEQRAVPPGAAPGCKRSAPSIMAASASGAHDTRPFAGLARAGRASARQHLGSWKRSPPENL